MPTVRAVTLDVMRRPFRFGTVACFALLVCVPVSASKAGRTGKASGGATSLQRSRQFLAQGLRQSQRGRHAAAVAKLRKAAELDGSSAAVFFHLGNAHYQMAFRSGKPGPGDMEDVREAESAFQTAMALDPALASLESPYLLYHELALCYQALEKYGEALSMFDRAMRVAPSNPMPAVYTARLYHGMGDPSKSAASLEIGIQRARRVGNFHSLKQLLRSNPGFSLLTQAPENRAVLDAYDQVEQGLLTEAQAREKLEDAAEYRDSLRNASPSELRKKALQVPRQSSRLLARINEGDMNLKFRSFQAAIAEYQAALEEDGGNEALDPALKSRVLRNMGVAYRHLGQASEAVKVLGEVLRDPQLGASAYYQLALVYSVTGRYTHAINALDRSLREAPNQQELRQTMLLAKTDPELDPIRDRPEFQKMLEPYSRRMKSAR